MKTETALILKGFIAEMSKDISGWCNEFMGGEAYYLYRALEHPEDVPKEKKK